jgi:hypothetical protein
MPQMWMIERGHGADLALEARSRGRITGNLGRQHFQRDAAIQPGVARAIHLAHPARAEGLLDFVSPSRVPPFRLIAAFEGAMASSR